MRQHNPPHPGKFIRRTYLEPHDMSARQVAIHLDVSPSTFSPLIAEQNKVTPDMAIRLSKVLGRSPKAGYKCRQTTISGKQSKINLMKI